MPKHDNEVPVTDKPQPPEDKQPQDKQPEGRPTPSSPEKSAPEAKANAAGAESGSPGEAGGKSPARGSSAPATPETAAKPKKSGHWLTMLLAVILLASVAGLAYQQWSHQQHYRSVVTQLNQQLSGQLDQLGDLSRSLDTVRQSVSQAARQLGDSIEQQQQVQRQTAQLEGQVRDLRRQVQAMSTTTAADWKLAEAYYLTRLAEQRLLMERDSGSALALLQVADKIVKNHPDPDIHPVRAALADDIAALKLAGSVDREGLYLRIAALGRQIDQLPAAEPLNYRPENDKDGAPDAAQTVEENRGIWESIQQSFARAVERLKDFVRVTRRDQPLEVPPSPQRQLYLQASLRTALDAAQLALLREQPAIYRDSLQKAQTLVIELYAQSPRRGNVLTELAQLETTQIRQPLPDITQSQAALGAYLDERHRVEQPIAPNDNAPSTRQEQEVRP